MGHDALYSNNALTDQEVTRKLPRVRNQQLPKPSDASGQDASPLQDSQAPGWNRSLLLTLAIYIATFLLVYAPCVVLPYAYADDYLVLSSYFQGWSKASLITITLGGRPVTAFLINVAFSHFASLGDLRYVRLIGVIGIALLAWALNRTLKAMRVDASVALFLPILICTLPPIALYASWASTSYYALGAALTGPAAMLSEYAWRFWARGNRLTSAYAFVGALTLQCIATAIYQPAAMMFWVFAAIYLLFGQRSLLDLIVRFAAQGIIVMVGLAVDLELSRTLPLLVFHSSATLGRTQLVQDIPGKAVWFAHFPLIDALNLWQLTPSHMLAYAVALIIIIGLPLFVEGSWLLRAVKLAIAVLLIPLAYIPNLVVAENWSPYRTEVALTALIALYTLLGMWGITRLAHRVVISISRINSPAADKAHVAPRLVPLSMGLMATLALATALIATHDVVRYFVVPNYLEYQLIRGEIRQLDLPTTKTIDFQLSCYDETSSPVVRYDEWGSLTSSISWAAPYLTYIELREVAPRYSAIPVKILAQTQQTAVLPAHTALLNAQLVSDYNPVAVTASAC